jgi:oxygen-independent coproporphyrinogen III oxidase
MTPAQLLQKYNIPVPRYTSYPPAHTWYSMSDAEYMQALGDRQNNDPVGLYVHIPFCQTICSYCGCHTNANHNPDVEETYVTLLCKEIALVHEKTGARSVTNVHFGGGTPTKLSCEQLSRIVHTISSLNLTLENTEYAIEVDPRNVHLNTEKLSHLKTLGFSRISLGIQDFDPKVQSAIGRNQQSSVSIAVYEQCRALDFSSIHFDLVYGLPHQTIASFHETISTVLRLKPNRISLFSFAYVPKLKSNQTYIQAKDIPSCEEKYAMFITARSQLIEGGYFAIGMDHFALKEDPLNLCQKKGLLHRNFQGYTPFKEEVIGFGESAISSLSTGFFQNHKSSSQYFERLNQGRLPTNRGILLSEEDQHRAFVINQLMCHFSIDKESFFEKFGVSFDQIFHNEISRLMALSQDGLLNTTPFRINATELGQVFIRNIAAIFDQYDPSSNASRTL